MNIKSSLIKVRDLVSSWIAAPEYIYLTVALVAVIGFSFITPPFQGPDEHAHYVRTQYIANGYLIPVNAKKNGASLPYSIDQVTEKTFYDHDIRGDTNKKYNLNDTKVALNIPYHSNVQTSPTMVSYSPVPYLPAVPFVALANLLNLSPLISMYLARIALGIVSVLIFFFAIRLLPYKKYFFAVVGLIPMMLFQQAMITADSISYALLALFISYLLYLRHTIGSVLTRKQWIFLGTLCLLITIVKPLVFLFLPLILLLLKKKHALRWIGGVAVASAVLLVSWMLVISTASGADTVASTTPAEVNSSEQTQVVRENPKRAVRVLWNSYMTQYGDDEVRGVVGIFGAADTLYPLWMFALYVIILGLFAVMSNDKRMHMPKRWQILTAGIAILYFLIVNYALYTGYTPVNFNIVYGVQGRYFLPIIIASVIIFAGGVYVAKREFNKFLPRALAIVFILILLALFITIQRYYLYTP
jgi:uncharacterized membrane protein